MVGVFFVVSGFILTTKPLQLTRRQDHAGLYRTIASCMFRRWFRLWLPAFFSTFIGAMAVYAGLDIDSPTGPMQHPKLETLWLQIVDWFWEMIRFSSPFQYADHHTQLRMKYDWVVWTLPLEYWAGISVWVVCMAVCQFPSYATRLVILLVGSWISLYHGAWHFFCFLAGMIIADFQIESKTFDCSGRFFDIFTHERRQKLYWAIFIFGLYMAGAPGVEFGDYDLWQARPPGYTWLYSLIPHWFNEPHRFYVAWTGVALVFATNRLPPLQRLFESPLTQGFARCSFPFFLLHQVIHDIVVRNWLGQAITRTLNLNMSTTLGYNTWYFLMLALSTPIIYFCSRLFQVYIDDKCTLYVKRFEVFLQTPPAAQSPSLSDTRRSSCISSSGSSPIRSNPAQMLDLEKDPQIEGLGIKPA